MPVGHGELYYVDPRIRVDQSSLKSSYHRVPLGAKQHLVAVVHSDEFRMRRFKNRQGSLYRGGVENYTRPKLDVGHACEIPVSA